LPGFGTPVVQPENDSDDDWRRLDGPTLFGVGMGIKIRLALGFAVLERGAHRQELINHLPQNACDFDCFPFFGRGFSTQYGNGSDQIL